MLLAQSLSRQTVHVPRTLGFPATPTDDLSLRTAQVRSLFPDLGTPVYSEDLGGPAVHPHVRSYFSRRANNYCSFSTHLDTLSVGTNGVFVAHMQSPHWSSLVRYQGRAPEVRGPFMDVFRHWNIVNSAKPVPSPDGFAPAQLLSDYELPTWRDPQWSTYTYTDWVFPELSDLRWLAASSLWNGAFATTGDQQAIQQQLWKIAAYAFVQHSNPITRAVSAVPIKISNTERIFCTLIPPQFGAALVLRLAPQFHHADKIGITTAANMATQYQALFASQELGNIGITPPSGLVVPLHPFDTLFEEILASPLEIAANIGTFIGKVVQLEATLAFAAPVLGMRRLQQQLVRALRHLSHRIGIDGLPAENAPCLLPLNNSPYQLEACLHDKNYIKLQLAFQGGNQN